MENEAPRRVATGPDGQPLFSHLLSSKPPTQRGGPLATFTSLVAHAALILLVVWVTQRLQNRPQSEKEEQVTLIEIPQEEEPPPPPPPPPPPDQPPPPQVTTMADVPKGFQTLAPPDIVPPDIPLPSTGPEISEADFSGEGVQGGRAAGEKIVTAENIEAAPVFTPYTVSPELRNRDEVARALVRFYPPLLRDAGIGGQAVIWFFIDENGRVIKTQIQKSSGQQALDEAALKVADVMRFTPALNRDQKVKVWVAIPIVFSAK